MEYIANLDRKKFKAITNNIDTEEVILTNNQMQHIKERHPNDYESYYMYIKEIIEKPDYIMKDKYPDTAILLKEIEQTDKKFYLVLRLHTNKDKIGYKNSIITFWKIGKSKYGQYLRTKQIVYKSLDIDE